MKRIIKLFFVLLLMVPLAGQGQWSQPGPPPPPPKQFKAKGVEKKPSAGESKEKAPSKKSGLPLGGLIKMERNCNVVDFSQGPTLNEQDHSHETGLFDNHQALPSDVTDLSPINFESDFPLITFDKSPNALASRETTPKTPPIENRTPPCVGTVLAGYPAGVPPIAAAQSPSQGYARLMVQGPGQFAVARLNLPAGLNPHRISFAFRIAQIFPASHAPILTNASAKLIVNGTEHLLLPSACTDYPMPNVAYDAMDIPTLRICAYDPFSLDLPNRPTEATSMEWRLDSNDSFVASVGCQSQCPEGRVRCSTFTPLLYLSLDNIVLEPQAFPNLTCSRYEVPADSTVRCFLNTPAPRDSSFYKFRVKPQDGGSAPIFNAGTLDNKPSIQFKRTTPGLYVVDAWLQKEINGHPFAFGKSLKEAHVWVRISGGDPPIPARVTESTSVVFPPRKEGCVNPNIDYFKVYRKNLAEERGPQDEESSFRPSLGGASCNGEPLCIGVTDRSRGHIYLDNTVQPGTNPLYAMRPVFNDGHEGSRSTWDTTTWNPGILSVALDHFSLPGDSGHFQAGFTPPRGSSSGLAAALIPPRLAILRGSLDNVQNVLGFNTRPLLPPVPGAEPLYGPLITLGGVLIAGRADALQGTFTLVAQPELPQSIQRDDYTGLPPSQLFYLVSGDLTKSRLLRSDILTAIELVQGDPVTSPQTIGLDRCSFEGNQFLCSAPNPLPFLGINMPTPHQFLGERLRRLFYWFAADAGRHGGLLTIPTWKIYVDENRASIFPHSEAMTDLEALSSPQQSEVLLNHAKGLATYEASQLARFNMEHNLFGTGSSFELDWTAAYDQLFYLPLIAPAAAMARQNGQISNEQSSDEALLIAEAIGFFADLSRAHRALFGLPRDVDEELKILVDYIHIHRVIDGDEPPAQTTGPAATVEPAPTLLPDSNCTTDCQVIIFAGDKGSGLLGTFAKPAKTIMGIIQARGFRVTLRIVTSGKEIVDFLNQQETGRRRMVFILSHAQEVLGRMTSHIVILSRNGRPAHEERPPIVSESRPGMYFSDGEGLYVGHLADDAGPRARIIHNIRPDVLATTDVYAMGCHSRLAAEEFIRAGARRAYGNVEGSSNYTPSGQLINEVNKILLMGPVYLIAPEAHVYVRNPDGSVRLLQTLSSAYKGIVYLQSAIAQFPGI